MMPDSVTITKRFAGLLLQYVIIFSVEQTASARRALHGGSQDGPQFSRPEIPGEASATGRAGTPHEHNNCLATASSAGRFVPSPTRQGFHPEPTADPCLSGRR